MLILYPINPLYAIAAITVESLFLFLLLCRAEEDSYEPDEGEIVEEYEL